MPNFGKIVGAFADNFGKCLLNSNNFCKNLKKKRYVTFEKKFKDV